MDDLEDRLRRGHPEERTHRPAPFADVATRPRPVAHSGVDGRIRFATLIAAGFAIVAVGLFTRPLGVPGNASRQESAGQAPTARTADRASDAPLVPNGPGVGAGGAPSPAASPAVSCGPAAEPECRVLVAAVAHDVGARLSSLEVSRFVPACIRTRECMPPWGGYERFLVEYETADAVRAGAICDASASSADCRPAPAEELADLATVVVTLEGAARTTVMLRDAAGTERPLFVAPSAQQELRPGRWTVRLRDEPDCAVAFDAGPAQRVDALVRIPDQGSCRIEIRPG